MSLLRTIRTVLREIFEEAAYERFCLRKGLSRDRDSYASFLRETSARASLKVKCC